MIRLLNGGRIALLVTLLAASLLGLAPFSSQPAAAATLHTGTFGRPDLAIINVQHGYNAGWYLAVTLKNYGPVGATGFYTDYNGYVRSLPGLAAGATAVVSFPLAGCPTSGTITVDVFKQVLEQIETNNSQIVQMTLC